MESAEVQIIVGGVVVHSVTVGEEGESITIRHIRNVCEPGQTKPFERVKQYLLFGRLKGVHLQGA